MSDLLDLIYPPKCALCGVLGPEPVCGICVSSFISQPPIRYKTPAPLDYATSLYDYTGAAAQAVQLLKYRRVTSLAKWMATLMRTGAEERGLLSVDAMIPVPIHWSREGIRGFNQSEVLCDSMPPDLVRKNLLRRVKATRSQVGLSHEERTRNLTGAFEASGSELGSVLLVDDVVTSGGTAVQCAAALKAAGATEVGVFTFGAERRWRLG